MAKPSWITVVSESTGSGSGARSLKASSHTGRSIRSGSIKGVTSGGASDSVVLSQVGAGEFIVVDNTSYSVTALGGTVKITGTSNSQSLKLTNLTDLSLLSNFALKVNGTAYSWDGNVSHQISGDPGASSSYTFDISFDVAENQTESSKNITFKLTDSGNTEISSDIITIIQAAGKKTYGTPNVNLRYYDWRIPASGGIASPTYSFSIPWGWNGKTSGGGTLTEADTHTVTYAYVNGGPVSPFDWTLDPTTGVITMASLKTNQTTQDSGNIFIKITIEINGQTLEDNDYVLQDENIATYVLSSASVSLDDIPASGGSADSPNFVSASGKIDYSSGESDTPSITSSDVIITLSKTVNGSNLGSTIKARTKLDTVTATITWNGSQITQSIDVYQQANQVTYSSVNATSATVNSSGSGKEIDIEALLSPKQTATYTSGTTKDVNSFSYNFRKKPSWITIDELTLKATVDKNVTGSTRDGVIRITLIGMGNRFTLESISVHQEALVMPSWDVPATFHFDQWGQSDLSPAGLDLNISDPDSVGWIIEGPSYVTGTAVASGSLPIMGIGNKSISLAPNVNTSSERTFYLVLETSAGDAIATCSCTQEAGTQVEPVHTLTITHPVCDKLNNDSAITICVSPFGTISEFGEDNIQLGTTKSISSTQLIMDVPHSVIEQLSSKFNGGDWQDYNYLYFWVQNGITKPNAVPVFGSSSKTYFINNFVFYEYDLITSGLRSQLSNFAASGNTDSIDLSETYGVNMLSTRKMTLRGTFPIAFFVNPGSVGLKLSLRLSYHIGNASYESIVFPYQLIDDIGYNIVQNNYVSTPQFRRDIPLTQSSNDVTFDNWNLLLDNNNDFNEIKGDSYDGNATLYVGNNSYYNDFGFVEGDYPYDELGTPGDIWDAWFGGDQNTWNFGELNNDCTMVVGQSSGHPWIALL